VRYFWPLNADSRREFDKLWQEVINQSGGKPTYNAISVMFGRALMVPESCSGVARFNFDYLCGRATGAADYIAIARNYHTVFISDIPVMSMRIRDKARRFITLIDELYNNHCCLFCLADSSIEDLFVGTDEGTLFDLESFQFETETESVKLRRDVLAAVSVGLGPTSTGITSLMSGQEEMFAFRRAVSRLIEMQKPLYIESARLLHPMYPRHTHLQSENFLKAGIQLGDNL
ncbi:lactation elevated protein 1-like, partial [Phalaenopsis equestris]|uniref:lactation elevated protein 1-like n=1 Tax=Phalaenopsis equestris TaxID=78828 RepID=UPI0009E1CFF9